MIKNTAFPQYRRHKSVKQTKEMREKFAKIDEYLKSNSKLEMSEIDEKIKEILS